MNPRVSLQDVSMGVRFLTRLPSFLRHPIGVAAAKMHLQQRFSNRESDFLWLAKDTIYQNPASPYLNLLHMAGCQYGDLVNLVRREGLEHALRALYAEGVFLTVDEIKGRRPVVRGHKTFDLDPALLRNPLAAGCVMTESGGSRTVIAGAADLAIMEDESINRGLNLFARGGLGWTHAFWSVPGGAAIEEILGQSKFGVPPERWFVKLHPAASGLHPRYRWSARVMRWGSTMAGRPLPRPIHVPYDDPLPIIEWMRARLASGKTPQLKAPVSSAVHLCRTALERNLDIAGAQFIVSGEPLTATRLSRIRSAGAVPHPLYGSAETGVIAVGCLNPGRADDLHLFNDLHAVIQPGEPAPVSLHPRTLLFTSLRPKARMVLINVSLGDHAVLETGKCGCALEQLGWRQHIGNIRSHEKLTSGGVCLLDTDAIRFLEEVLPANFGGGPTDYQLVEGEREDGTPRLSLLVHPSVGVIDERDLAAKLLESIGRDSGSERIVSLLWRAGKFIEIQRRPPRKTRSGKILHLHSLPAKLSCESEP